MYNIENKSSKLYVVSVKNGSMKEFDGIRKVVEFFYKNEDESKFTPHRIREKMLNIFRDFTVSPGTTKEVWRSFEVGYVTDVIPYYLINGYGTILNIKDFEKEFLSPIFTKKKTLRWNEYYLRKYHFVFRRTPVPHTGVRNFHRRIWGNGHKRSRLVEASKYDKWIRPAQRTSKIKDSIYFDYFETTPRSWKTQNKCKKQWQIHL